MKKIFFILSVVGLLFAGGCSHMLDTDPTDRVSGTKVGEDAQNALAALNGTYRLFNKYGWGSDWEPENGGLAAYILTFSLKADDHLMDDEGSGWFFYDYAFDTQGDWTHKAGHQYQIWNFFYTIISNANYILANEGDLPGDSDLVDYVIGQAYALRSFAYMWLVQVYAQSWDVTAPGVPLYSEPTVAGTEGAPRGTVQDVFTQANDDIDRAIELLERSSISQQHRSHIDKYVAYGIKARHALVQKDWPTALTFAEKALEGRAQVANFPEIRTVNDISKPNVMWGFGVQSDQAIGGADIFYHMDPNSESTYSQARHLVATGLYNLIPANDARKEWWTEPLPEEDWGEAGTSTGSMRDWCQTKLMYLDATASTGDHIWMRAEEMALIAAEAACHAENWSDARDYVAIVGDLRMANYAARLSNRTNSKNYNSDVNAPPSTLMEEILFQRRVELWGEVPRLFDLIRLGLGIDRDYSGSNHTVKVTYPPYHKDFLLWIPQSEFDGNENMDPSRDQNP